MPDTQHVEVTHRGSLVGPRVQGFLRLRGEDHMILVRQLSWPQRRAEELCYDFRGMVSWHECVWIGKLLKADPYVLICERHIDGAPVAPGQMQRFIPAFFTKGDKACGDRLLETLRTLGLASDRGSAITGLVRNVRGFGGGKALKVLQGEAPITLASFDLLIETLGVEEEAILGPEWPGIAARVRGEGIIYPDIPLPVVGPLRRSSPEWTTFPAAPRKRSQLIPARSALEDARPRTAYPAAAFVPMKPAASRATVVQSRPAKESKPLTPAARIDSRPPTEEKNPRQPTVPPGVRAIVADKLRRHVAASGQTRNYHAKQLAARTEFSHAYFHTLMADTGRLSETTIAVIAEYCGQTVEELLALTAGSSPDAGEMGGPPGATPEPHVRGETPTGSELNQDDGADPILTLGASIGVELELVPDEPLRSSGPSTNAEIKAPALPEPPATPDAPAAQPRGRRGPPKFNGGNMREIVAKNVDFLLQKAGKSRYKFWTDLAPRTGENEHYFKNLFDCRALLTHEVVAAVAAYLDTTTEELLIDRTDIPTFPPRIVRLKSRKKPTDRRKERRGSPEHNAGNTRHVVAKNVLRLLAHAGTKQRRFTLDLASRTGMTARYFRNLLESRSELTEPVLDAIAAYLATTVEWLLEEHTEDAGGEQRLPASSPVNATGTYVLSANDRRARDILDHDPDLKDLFFGLVEKMRPLPIVDRAVLVDTLEAVLANVRSAQAA